MHNITYRKRIVVNLPHHISQNPGFRHEADINAITIFFEAITTCSIWVNIREKVDCRQTVDMKAKWSLHLHKILQLAQHGRMPSLQHPLEDISMPPKGRIWWAVQHVEGKGVTWRSRYMYNFLPKIYLVKQSQSRMHMNLGGTRASYNYCSWKKWHTPWGCDFIWKQYNFRICYRWNMVFLLIDKFYDLKQGFPKCWL